MSGADEAPPRGRRERRRTPSLASALAGATLLVVLGFALGVVGGLVMEEPDLLLDYVLGRTEQVAIGEAGAPEPDVAAAPAGSAAVRGGAGAPPGASVEQGSAAAGTSGSSAGGSAPPDTRPGHGDLATAARAGAGPAAPAAEATAPPATAADEVAAAPSVAAAPPAAGFAVQVGAFAEPAAAEQLARRLKEHGHPVYVAPATGADGPRWRVRVGPLATRSEADALAARLQREERVATWVLAEGRP